MNTLKTSVLLSVTENLRARMTGFAMLVSAGAIALGALSPITANATVYDVVTGFSTTSNPNGPFGYGYRLNAGSLVPYDASTPACAGITGLECQYSSTFNNNNLPAVGINATGSLINTGSVRIPTGELFLHPVGQHSGLADDDTIVRFTAPVAGFYSIAGLFQILDVNASGVHVSVEGGTSSFSTILGGALNSTAAFSFGTMLALGGTLDFAVNSNGSYFNDSIGLQATLSVPEPMSIAVLGIGLAALGAARRRRA